MFENQTDKERLTVINVKLNNIINSLEKQSWS